MQVWSHDRWRIPLPDGHKFPIDKYERLRQQVEAEGVVIHESEPVPWEWLSAVHDDGLLARIRDGTMTLREQRGLGLPWSEVLVERGRRSVGGTLGAAGPPFSGVWSRLAPRTLCSPSTTAAWILVPPRSMPP